MTATIASPRATRREWAGLAVLALPTLLLSIDIFVLLLLLVAGPVLLPEYRSPGAGRLEPGSVALSLGAVIKAVYGLTSLARWIARQSHPFRGHERHDAEHEPEPR